MIMPKISENNLAEFDKIHNLSNPEQERTLEDEVRKLSLRIRISANQRLILGCIAANEQVFDNVINYFRTRLDMPDNACAQHRIDPDNVDSFPHTYLQTTAKKWAQESPYSLLLLSFKDLFRKSVFDYHSHTVLLRPTEAHMIFQHIYDLSWDVIPENKKMLVMYHIDSEDATHFYWAYTTAKSTQFKELFISLVDAPNP